MLSGCPACSRRLAAGAGQREEIIVDEAAFVLAHFHAFDAPVERLVWGFHEVEAVFGLLFIAHMQRRQLRPGAPERLMQKMGIQAIYPKPKLSQAHREHKVYPYLLRGVAITRPNQVWHPEGSRDITYIPMRNGFMHLVAVIDWYSRYVLAWQLSNTLESTFCIEALRQALTQGRPDIFNTDQGVQFTAIAFAQVLEAAEVQISMDSKGRALDNVFIERAQWAPGRSVKYEDIYLKHYDTVPALVLGLDHYFTFYNQERRGPSGPRVWAIRHRPASTRNNRGNWAEGCGNCG